MNRIIVSNNIILDYEGNGIEIEGNRIRFVDSGNYILEYSECDEVGIEIELVDGVLVRLFVWNMNDDIIINNHYVLGENSRLYLSKFSYCGKVFENIVFDLDKRESLLDYHFSGVSLGSEEYHIIVNHNDCDVSSNVVNKCVGLDGSRIKIEIDSVLGKGNDNCVMNQTSRVLTIGDVDAVIIPNMLIEDESVIAKHGSVVGRINPDDVFYLMSRGIEEKEAVFLLIKGFIFSNLDVDMDKRAKIFKIIQDLRR